MEGLLRPLTAADLPLLDGADSEFEDFGPHLPRTAVPPCDLHQDGALAVVGPDGLAGTVTWRWVQWGPTAGSRCPMIGIWIAAAQRGRGLGTRAQRTLAELFFRHTTVNRVEAHTDLENLPEQRSLEKAGFVRDGVIRGAQWRDGGYHDGPLYSMLRAEWRDADSADPG